MNAIILAAGVSSRLNNNKTLPKCLLKIGEQSLLERALQQLVEVGISKTVIVVGYCSDQIINLVGTTWESMTIEYVHNEEYLETNNCYSLLLASTYFSEDTILMDSDIIIEDTILDQLMRSTYANVALVANCSYWSYGSVVQIDENNKITMFSHTNTITDSETRYKTLNIYKLSSRFLQKCIPLLGSYCSIKKCNKQKSYELIFALLVKDETMKAMHVRWQKWHEIDYPQDVLQAQFLFANQKKQFDIIQSSHGGYWRYPHIVDFCYLVNPFYPPTSLIDELQSSFQALLTHYPSSAWLQSILAGSFLGIDPNDVIVGNGASELIKALLSTCKSKVGVVVPVFEEYLQCCNNAQIVYFYAEDFDFSPTINSLIDFSEQVDYLILVNPDNPTGYQFPLNDILILIQYLESKNKKLIVDESFIDFSCSQQSILSSVIIKKYKSLIVIKSISKSHGVPGLRLGVLVNSDLNILSKVRQAIPVWNVNSFAEFFMQIAIKYKNEHYLSCNLLTQERVDFQLRLQENSYLKIYPSQANYIFCKVLPPVKVEDLTMYLYTHNIYIKNCDKKTGLKHSYIRIAVKTKEDNHKLLYALNKYLTHNICQLNIYNSLI